MQRSWFAGARPWEIEVCAGTAIIQVDEPSSRELLPLRSKDKDACLRWAVDAFQLSTTGVADSTQILDADVTSIEAARSH